tara:strand:- start:5769 stop:5942 length:174 start_codon:yes stop_codon:yes gene_type:complete
MSIKAFHILFIVFSFILSMGVGYWGIKDYPIIALLSFVVGVLLLYYGIQIFKKFKTI